VSLHFGASVKPILKMEGTRKSPRKKSKTDEEVIAELAAIPKDQRTKDQVTKLRVLRRKATLAAKKRAATPVQRSECSKEELNSNDSSLPRERLPVEGSQKNSNGSNSPRTPPSDSNESSQWEKQPVREDDIEILKPNLGERSGSEKRNPPPIKIDSRQEETGSKSNAENQDELNFMTNDELRNAIRAIRNGNTFQSPGVQNPPVGNAPTTVNSGVPPPPLNVTTTTPFVNLMQPMPIHPPTISSHIHELLQHSTPLERPEDVTKELNVLRRNLSIWTFTGLKSDTDPWLSIVLNLSQRLPERERKQLVYEKLDPSIMNMVNDHFGRNSNLYTLSQLVTWIESIFVDKKDPLQLQEELSRLQWDPKSMPFPAFLFKFQQLVPKSAGYTDEMRKQLLYHKLPVSMHPFANHPCKTLNYENFIAWVHASAHLLAERPIIASPVHPVASIESTPKIDLEVNDANAIDHTTRPRADRPYGPGKKTNNQYERRCFQCNSTEHLVANCPERNGYNANKQRRTSYDSPRDHRQDTRKYDSRDRERKTPQKPTDQRRDNDRYRKDQRPSQGNRDRHHNDRDRDRRRGDRR
jgi:hypothetical protein